ncbi:MAG: hypothetical protein ACRDT3_10145 [Glutamicibacter sp.]
MIAAQAWKSAGSREIPRDLKFFKTGNCGVPDRMYGSTQCRPETRRPLGPGVDLMFRQGTWKALKRRWPKKNLWPTTRQDFGRIYVAYGSNNYFQSLARRSDFVVGEESLPGSRA